MLKTEKKDQKDKKELMKRKRTKIQNKVKIIELDAIFEINLSFK